jgi:uncharacterized membrane protein HdeD (DUF308 family)
MAETVLTCVTDETKKSGQFHWWLILLWGVLAMILGILFLVTPAMTTLVFVTFLGAYWFVGGVFTLGSLVVNRTNMGWKIFVGILNIIAGILVLAYPLYSTLILLGFFVIALGFWAVFMGFVHLYHAFSVQDAGSGILGIISLIFGILLFVFPYASIIMVPLIAGVVALALGISAVIFSFTAKEIQAV